MNHTKSTSSVLSSYRAKLFAIGFLIAAFAITYWSMQRIPHSVVLHVNDKWHIMLVGETDPNNVQFYTRNFNLIRENAGNIWLTGTGKITWQEHTIVIHKAGIRLGQHNISTSNRELNVNLMLYPDGRVTKGQAKLIYKDKTDQTGASHD